MEFTAPVLHFSAQTKFSKGLKYCLAILILILGWSTFPQSGERQLAFPTAEGFGRFTTGGRGGSVIAVTNLDDHGPGSLRAAVKARGARTITFRVSGTIALQSALEIRNDDITIAGQTAPGEGICIRNYPVLIWANNVIIRYLRIRLGDETRQQADAISCMGQKDIIIDHCSFSWGIDEVASFYDNENLTVQWCIISESLHNSIHEKGPHGYGGIWGGKGASFHHNLIAHNASRNPRFNGSRTHGQADEEIVDFRNNVIYNWGANSAYGGEAGQQNMIANYYKAGPASKHRDRIVEPWDENGKWYVADNFVVGYPAITADNWAGGVQGKFRTRVRVDAPHAVAPVVTHTAEQAYELVLTNVGATLPRRDSVDRRIIAEVRNGTAMYGGKWGARSGIIDSQKEAGGWPTLHSTDAPADEDHDGIADAWERANGLDPTNPDDHKHVADARGYTNLELYLNHLASTARVEK